MSRDPNFHQIGKPEQLDRLIAHTAALELVGRVELFRAVRDGTINLIEVGREAPAPLRIMEQSPRPVVLVLGDDDYASTGPTGWAAWQRVSYWARAATVHATGADVASYQMAIGMALLRPRFLLVQTDSAHAHEWAEALHRRRIPALGLLPLEGIHPVPPPREAMQ
jgi:hypothetical protein